jgi:hypothetical protein
MTQDEVIIYKISRKNILKLIIANLNTVQLKSSDFQILMYVIYSKPEVFISFDKRLKREYTKIASNKDKL